MARQQKQSQSEKDEQPLLSVATLTKSQRRKLQSFSYQNEVNGTIGILVVILTVAIAVRFPAYYWIWHLVWAAYYLPTRYVRFKERGKELYLLDWCYVVTYLSNACAILAFIRIAFGIQTVLVNYNADLIRAGFAMAGGPLAASIIVFRNSMVFHDIEYVTSVFIHLSPFVLFWCLRWGAGVPSVIENTFPGMFMVCPSEEEFAAADACLRSFRGMLWCNACSAPPSAFVVPAAFVYIFVWAIPYFWIVMVRWRDWIEKTNRETLYSYYCNSQPGLDAMFEKKLAVVVGRRYASPLGYMLLHCVASISLSAMSYILWHSFLLHNLVLLIIVTNAIHNGNTYMFRVFAYRYAEEQLELHRARLLD